MAFYKLLKKFTPPVNTNLSILHHDIWRCDGSYEILEAKFNGELWRTTDNRKKISHRIGSGVEVVAWLVL